MTYSHSTPAPHQGTQSWRQSWSPEYFCASTPQIPPAHRRWVSPPPPPLNDEDTELTQAQARKGSRAP